MEPTAVVSVTCPRCGGNVDALRAVRDAQATRCPYCRMELHVPAIGQRIVERWVVQEVRVRRRNRIAIAFAPLIAVITISIATCDRASHPIDRVPVTQPRGDTCIERCPAACARDADPTMCEAACVLRCP